MMRTFKFDIIFIIFLFKWSVDGATEHIRIKYQILKFMIELESSEIVGCCTGGKKFNKKAKYHFQGYRNWENSEQFRYVQQILKGEKRVLPSRSWFSKVCYDTTSFYRYHSRILSAIFCGSMGVYYLIVVLSVIFIPYLYGLADWLSSSWDLIAPIVALLDASTAQRYDVDRTKEWTFAIIKYIEAVPICLSVATCVAVLVTLFNFYRLMVNYIEHYQQIRRGDYTHIHVAERTPTSLMTGNLKYQAYQTSYFIVGFIIQVSF